MSRNGVARHSPGPTVKANRLPEQPSGPLVRQKVIICRLSTAALMVNYVLDKIDDPE
jgi:hypothetical protein